MNSNAHPLLLHLAPGDPEPVREQIARQLRDRIARGELAAGEPLPGHRQLARQHRIAPSTVEAAYELLLADGLLTGVAENNVMVATLDPERRREFVERLQLEKLVAQELGRRELEMARDGELVLRTGRDELSETWRRVSFRLQEHDVDLPGVVEHRRVRAEHQVITRDAEATLQKLTELGAEAVEVSRMSVDEIAVQILKEGHHVARAAS